MKTKTVAFAMLTLSLLSPLLCNTVKSSQIYDESIQRKRSAIIANRKQFKIKVVVR